MKRFHSVNQMTLMIYLAGFSLVLLCVIPAGFLLANTDSATSLPATSMPSSPSGGLRIVEMSDKQTVPAEMQKYTISDCYRLALKESDTVTMKKEEIQKAVAQLLEASSEAFGDVNFVMTDFHQSSKDSGSVGGSIANSFTAPEIRERKFVYNQPVFQGFKAFGALMGAGSLRKQRTQEWVRAEQLLLLDVVIAFYNVLQAKRDIEVTREILKSYDERIVELREREKIGRSRLSEVLTAEVGMKMGEAELAGYRGLLAVQEHILAFLTGAIIKAEQLVDTTVQKEMPRTVEEYLNLIRNRPDVKATYHAAKTAWQGVVVAQSGFWPQLSLEGNNYVHREGFEDGINWDMLFRIDVPIFEGFANAGKVKQAWSDWKLAKSQYRLTQREAALEIKKAFEIWMTAHNRYRSLEEAVRVSEQNYRLEAEEYTRSLVNNLDVLQALRSLLESRRQANQAFYQSKVETWRLKVAVGETIS